MSRLGPRLRPETLLRSLAPFVPMAQSTDARLFLFLEPANGLPRRDAGALRGLFLSQNARLISNRPACGDFASI